MGVISRRQEIPRPPHGCPEFTRGTFSINAYQLYPENMDWDAKLCQVYIGILFNASFGIYDLYKDKLDVVEFPGITRVKEFHVGAVAWDKHSGHATTITGQGNAFETFGANISGDNFIKRYNPYTRKFIWSLNITAVSKGLYGGFNDITYDPLGNAFVCGTYPASILKVDPKGKGITPWYLPSTIVPTEAGYSGIAAHEYTIVALNSGRRELVRFDAKASRGTPISIPVTPVNHTAFTSGDAIRLPLKYEGKVLLVAQKEGIAVLRSRNTKWKAAEYLGFIRNAIDIPPGWNLVAPAQIGDNLYILNDWFLDPIVPGTVAGNKTSFPLIDITREVDALVRRRKSVGGEKE
ncbi:hypothetical protein QBC35DRAFT_518459 [Podospora australis]|uniref:Uncharacterized protein n=1 Tax=Podospora australis TaxID=1536484 RepID=A0AAN7AC12_9PEZI|nr:hypothetical protein QBC35DRAFT_518459 [Podospora australis]